MTHKRTALGKRTEIARSALSFVGILEKDKQGKPKVLIVPGSEGKRYQVIIRRHTNSVSCECRCETGIGFIPCKGNSLNDTVCRHSLTAIAFSARLAGKKVSFCESERDARRLGQLGGRIIPIISWQSKGKIWGVAK